jgi:uncharacterized membrane protein YcjF (UPF0283 family)
MHTDRDYADFACAQCGLAGPREVLEAIAHNLRELMQLLAREQLQVASASIANRDAASTTSWLEDRIVDLEQQLEQERDRRIEAEQRSRALEYVSGYEVDLLTIRHVLNEVDAPHDPEDGVSLEPKRIRLLAIERDEALEKLAQMQEQGDD